jgi:hypothetical protein
MCVLAPGLSLSIIIHSRVKIIGNGRPGASPCDPRGRLHVHILRFHFLFHERFLFQISINQNLAEADVKFELVKFC